MQYVIGASIFSLNFIVTVVVFVVIILFIVFATRKLLWRKLDNELRLATIMYDDLYYEVNNRSWRELCNLSKTDSRVQDKIKEAGLSEQYKSLSESLVACKLLIDEFREDRLNGMDLKGADATLSFINGMMDTATEEVEEFYQLCESYLQLFDHNANKEEAERNAMVKESIVAKESVPLVQKIVEEKVVQQPIEAPTATMVSTIVAGTTIQGHIHSEQNLRIHGQVQGNVTSEGFIELHGGAMVQGNIIADQVMITQGKVIGNVEAEKLLNFAQDVWIKGNIKASKIRLAGIQEGNVQGDEVIVMPSANILGDVTSTTIEIAKGAVLNGTYTMK